MGRGAPVVGAVGGASAWSAVHVLRGRRRHRRRRRRARARGVRADERTASRHYDLGCLYIGVNDVRAFDWDPARFEPPLRRALAFLAGRCERVLAVTAPLDLGRPRAGAKVRELNAIVVGAAGGAGALVLDLSDFGGRNLVMADHVHPTAFGQIAIAERALAVLAGDGLVATVRPRELIRYETSRVERLRGDMTFAYRHAKVSARAVAVKARLAGVRGGGEWRRRRRCELGVLVRVGRSAEVAYVLEPTPLSRPARHSRQWRARRPAATRRRPPPSDPPRPPPSAPQPRRPSKPASRNRAANPGVRAPASRRHRQLPPARAGSFIRASLPSPRTSCAWTIAIRAGELHREPDQAPPRIGGRRRRAGGTRRRLRRAPPDRATEYQPRAVSWSWVPV